MSKELTVADIYSSYLDEIEDLRKQVKRLQEQLADANKLIKWCMKLGWSGNQEEDGFDRYCKKWGVK